LGFLGPSGASLRASQRCKEDAPWEAWTVAFCGFFCVFFFNREWRYREGQGGRKDQLNPREGREEEGLLHSRCK